MDPVSIIGLIGSIVSIADVVAKSIHRLSELKSKYRNVSFQVTTLIGQLHIIQAAIGELNQWKSKVLAKDPRYHELATQVQMSLDCFCPLIMSLQQYLDDIDIASVADRGSSNLQGKLSYLWNEPQLAIFIDLVDRQVNALNLFLQAVQCNTWAEQQNKIDEEDSRAVLVSARDCSSSILGLVDGSSIFTENTNAVSLQFDFDTIILGSKVYQAAHRSHLKQVIKAARSPGQVTSANRVSRPRLPSVYESMNESPVNETHPSLTPRNRNESSIAGARVKDRTPAVSSNPAELSLVTAPTSESYKPSNWSKAPVLHLLRYIRSSIRQSLHRRREIIEARTLSVEIDNRLQEMERKRAIEPKVLVLGTMGSGKFTILKAMKPFFEGNYTPQQRDEFKHTICTNVTLAYVTRNTRLVLEAMERLHIPLDDDRLVYHVQTMFIQPAEMDCLPPDLATAISSIWADRGFREARAIQWVPIGALALPTLAIGNPRATHIFFVIPISYL
ncbi:hypothetical protein F4778DRAFT_739040 [Xylariomycetidae sp. FL2044]|nr:hypothetical protein F4778DRAFT_739040 [Xylariomycetidae sp. FL2044]